MQDVCEHGENPLICMGDSKTGIGNNVEGLEGVTGPFDGNTRNKTNRLLLAKWLSFVELVRQT